MSFGAAQGNERAGDELMLDGEKAPEKRAELFEVLPEFNSASVPRLGVDSAPACRADYLSAGAPRWVPMRPRKFVIRSAIVPTLSSKTKCPPASRCTSASGTSRR